MKICVLGPSESYAKSAGSRIRYRRLEKWLKALGHSLEILSLNDVRESQLRAADVILFSKCYDARALLIARMLQGSGILVGMDFFDDVFSQKTDPRLIHWRRWAADVAEVVDFILCSTPRMQDVAAAYAPREHCHVLNDPFDTFDPLSLRGMIDAKVRDARAGRQIKVGWFGQGDNPRFPVGLRDLAAFGESLHALARQGWDVRLNVLTARKSLTSAALEQLQRLSVPYVVREWSVEAERKLLQDVLVAYIPVNGQSFSAAKSLNRAVSALTNGVQVLSDGYPLYDAFGNLIYSHAQGLSDDLESGMLRLRSETLPDLVDRMTRWGDPTIEATRLVSFLVRRKLQDVSDRPTPVSVAVLHGLDSPSQVNVSARRLGCLSIASPLSHERRDYDLAFVVEDGEARLRIHPDVVNRLAEDVVSCLSPSIDDRGAPRFDYDLSGGHEGERLRALLMTEAAGPLLRRLTYKRVIQVCLEICHRLLPGVEIILSETDPAAHAFWTSDIGRLSA